MLSKTERKILKETYQLAIKFNELQKKVHELSKKPFSKERLDTSREFHDVQDRLINYFSDYKPSYKGVLKHRIIKKTNRMLDDLILINAIHGLWGKLDKDLTINTYALFPLDKLHKLKKILPEDLKTLI